MSWLLSNYDTVDLANTEWQYWITVSVFSLAHQIDRYSLLPRIWLYNPTSEEQVIVFILVFHEILVNELALSAIHPPLLSCPDDCSSSCKTVGRNLLSGTGSFLSCRTIYIVPAFSRNHAQYRMHNLIWWKRPQHMLMALEQWSLTCQMSLEFMWGSAVPILSSHDCSV